MLKIWNISSLVCLEFYKNSKALIVVSLYLVIFLEKNYRKYISNDMNCKKLKEVFISVTNSTSAIVPKLYNFWKRRFWFRSNHFSKWCVFGHFTNTLFFKSFHYNRCKHIFQNWWIYWHILSYVNRSLSKNL